jgi:hypothetical protein
MNFKELVQEISQETKLSAGDVRKVGLAMLERFVRLIDEQQDFISPMISLKAVTTPAKPAAGDKPEIPERKFGRMTVGSKPQPAKEV